MNEIAKKLAGICVKNKLVAPEMFEWCVYSIEKKNGDILHRKPLCAYPYRGDSDFPHREKEIPAHTRSDNP